MGLHVSCVLTDGGVVDVVVGSDHAEVEGGEIHVILYRNALGKGGREGGLLAEPSTSHSSNDRPTFDCSKSASVFSTTSERWSDRWRWVTPEEEGRSSGRKEKVGEMLLQEVPR